MAVVSVRIDDKLREEMKKYDIDWNEELRHLIEQRISLERRRASWQRVEKIRSRIKPGFDSTRAIREDRDA